MNTSKSQAFNKLDQHWIIPILWLCMLPSSVCFIYLIHELSASPGKLTEYYQFSMDTAQAYKWQVGQLAAGFGVLFLTYYFAFKRNQRWLYLLTLAANVLLFYLFVGVL